mmetsp:Transcript_9507/g.15363  ORF Transcript_9507/g.15363 Transcript_9507/m.15363 type:complete len:245 (-) Transcript_9507:295-1029(-)|eukprot:jgi/Bigna1/89200/estExt_fgenesh1_pg.C_450081
MINEFLRVLAAALAIVALIFAIMSIVRGQWSVADVHMFQFPGPERTPDTTVDFGLYAYKAYLFGAKDAEWHLYTKIQQTDNVKYLEMAGEAVCFAMVGCETCLSLYILYGLLRAFYYGWTMWTARLIQDDSWSTLVEDCILIGLNFLACTTAILAVCFWGVAGHNASQKIQAALTSLPVPAVAAEASYGLSFTYAIIATLSSFLCCVLQIFIYLRNSTKREHGFAGGLIPNYDTFGSSSAPMPL